jgi:hypothetical protein
MLAIVTHLHFAIAERLAEVDDNPGGIGTQEFLKKRLNFG